MAIKRITPEQVVATYQEKGAKALQGTYLGYAENLKQPCGCLIGVMFATPEELQNPYNDGHVYEQRACDAGYEREYIKGLEYGFDKGFTGVEDNGSPYNAGARDGADAWNELYLKDLTIGMFDQELYGVKTRYST